jgi:hypothetical protein
LIYEEIKSRLSSGNACYHSVQNLLSSCLLSKIIKIKIHKNVIFPVVLYGSETWPLTVGEEQTEGVWEEGAKEDIRTKEEWGNRRLEKTA